MIPFLAGLFSQEGEGLIKTVGNIADDLITTDEERADANLKQYEAETERLKVEQAGASGQVEINKVEAAHPSLFVAGWRSAAGWTCVAGFLYHFIVYQFILWGLSVGAPHIVPPPPVDVGPLFALMTAMLGFAGVRSWDKYKGIARDRLRPPKKKKDDAG